MRALILCAGKGSRLGYKRTPKVMAKVNGKPILEHLVNHLNKAGINEIIVNVHKDYDKIFKYFGTRLLYFYEPTLLGEAGTERALSPWLGDRYVVMNGDTLTNVDILKMSQFGEDNTVYFFKDRYCGTKRVGSYARPSPLYWEGDGAYYFDSGTPAKLARARRALKK